MYRSRAEAHVRRLDYPERPRSNSLPGEQTNALSVIVPTFRRRELLAECLDSLALALRELPDACELIVVDNGSADGTTEFVQGRFPEVRLLTLGENLGFTGAVRQGLGAASGEWVAVFNDEV